MVKIDWQDIMIENFGKDWLKENYSITEIGKLARQLADLKDFCESERRKHFLEIENLKKTIKQSSRVLDKLHKRIKDLEDGN